MKAFILAGGFATRLWPLTEKRAKPLLSLAGKPLLTHIVSQIPAEIPIVVSTNAAFERGFRDWRETIDRPEIEILIESTRSDEEKLGALGAVRQWVIEERIHEDVLLLTGDNYFGFRIADFLSAAKPGVSVLAAHDIGDRERARAFGTILLTEDGKTVAGFEEKPQNPRTTLVSTGCSLLSASVLPILCEYAQSHPDNVGGIFEELLRRGQEVACFVFREPWFDVGSFGAYLEATRTLVGDRVLKGRDVRVDDTACVGRVVVGDGSRVIGGRLENVVAFGNCRIVDCDLRDCIIDEHCSLDGVDLSGKMLRAGTILTRRQ